MSRRRPPAALRREERRLGELGNLPGRALAAPMARLRPALLAAAGALAAGAGLGLAAAGDAKARAWSLAAAPAILVVPDPGAPAADGSGATRLEAARRLLGPEARVAPDLLRPWLGAEADAIAGVVEAAGPPDDALRARLASVVPGTETASAPAAPLAALARFGARLSLAGRLAAAACLLFAALAAFRAGHAALRPAEPAFRTLRLLGARPGLLARRAAWGAAWPVGCGAAAGGTCGAVVLVAGAGGPAAGTGGLVGGVAGPPMLALLGLACLGVTLLAAVAAALRARRLEPAR